VPGVLIALEGIDGCGKSTQAALLLERIVNAGLPAGPGEIPAVVREPGATPLGERVRDVLLHESGHVESWAEALLYAAARAQLAAAVLRPALGRGRIVVLDRYVDSSLAYQGWARGLGIDQVLGLNLLATGALLPAVTVVLRLSIDEAMARWGERPDRIEAEGRRFQARVAEGYERVMEAFPERVFAVDGSGAPDEVADRVWEVVARAHGTRLRGRHGARAGGARPGGCRSHARRAGGARADARRPHAHRPHAGRALRCSAR